MTLIIIMLKLVPSSFVNVLLFLFHVQHVIRLKPYHNGPTVGEIRLYAENIVVSHLCAVALWII